MIKIHTQTLLVYLLLALYTSLLSWLSSLAKTKGVRYLYGVLAIIIPSYIAAIRYNVGTDYQNYVAIFDGYVIRDFLEVGFGTLVEVISNFTSNSSVYFFILEIILMTFILASLLYYKEQLNVGLGMFVFMMMYYLTSLNITRQMVAVAIAFYSLRYIYENKILIFTGFILLASSFHVSAIIILPFYIIWKIDLFKENKNLFIFAILSIIIVLNLDYASNILLKLLPQFSYTHGYFTKKTGASISVLNIVKEGIFIISGYLVFRNAHLKNQTFSLMFVMYICGVILELSGGLYFNSAVSRIALPLKISLIYIVPYVTKQLMNKNFYLLSVANLGYVLIVFYFEFFIMGYGEVVPYQTIFK